METVVFGKRVVEQIEAGEMGNAAPRPDAISVRAPEGAAPTHHDLQHLMWDGAGIERSAEGMRQALAVIARWPAADRARTRAAFERRQMTVMASLMLGAALARTESRGAHFRSDYPEADDANWKRQQVFVNAG
jgi:L-aspartate oxidase